MLIYREIRGDLPEELSSLLWLRYRDNFLLLNDMDCQMVTLGDWTTALRCAFEKLSWIILEQQGQSITFLECQHDSPTGPNPITLPDCLGQPVEGSAPPQWQKLLDSTAPNALCMLPQGNLGSHGSPRW